MEKKLKHTGAGILVEALIEEGVDTVFGIPGGSVLFIYDELYKHRDRIRHILVSHEQHAAHAADGYARSTGKTGVCIATSGPGATNLITGIAAAYMDSVPVVAITGNVPTGILGKDSFQEVDIAGVSMPVVKHNWIVKDVNELAEIVREAFIVARSGRPGPVLIDIPKNITALEGYWTPRNAGSGGHESEGRGVLGARARRLEERNKRPAFTESDIEAAAKMLSEAKRPMLYAGGGVNSSGAERELARLAELLNAPVALSLMGIGAIPHNHRLCTGLIGMHGTVASNMAAQKADLIAALGARFSDRVISSAEKFGKGAKIIHFDIDPAEINKNIRCDAWVTGNLKTVLGKVLKKIPQKTKTEWNGEIDKWKQKHPSTNSAAHRGEISEKRLSPRFIIEETAARMRNDAIVVTDVGQHQIWIAQFYPINKPRSFLSSGGLGAMGYGLGAAEGAKIANPDRPVVLFTGDGSFRMNAGEMATVAACSIPILIIVFNNSGLGMIRQWQRLFYEGRYFAADFGGLPDYVKLAEAYGLRGFRAEDRPGFTAALKQALSEIAGGKAALIETVIAEDEQVLPMVPGGRPLDEQIL